MACTNIFIKDPDALLDYGIDFSEWLNYGDELIAVVWAVPAGLTNEGQSFSADGQTSIWLSGGVDGEEYEVVAHITTTGTVKPLEDDRTIILQMEER